VEDSDTKIVQVFYATDRARSVIAGEFQNVRAGQGALSLGRISVSIPPKHRLGEIERPSWWTFQRDNPDNFLVITDRTVDAYDDFYAALRQRVASSPERDAFVFVHGYNVGFDDAVFRTAQIAHDLTFKGAPILYSWPSRASYLAYAYDTTSSQQTMLQLQFFLADVSNRTGATSIHLIAHSMGNHPLTRAVAQLQRADRSKFRHIILAAPDIDAVVFRDEIAPRLTSPGSRVTLYASSQDQALVASKIFNGAQRAGDSRDPLLLAGIDTIDASNVVTDLLGHSPFVPSVLMDIYSLIRDGRAPGERFAMDPVPPSAPRLWVFRPAAR